MAFAKTTTLKPGETFNMYGNYFQIDLSSLPTAVRPWDSDKGAIGVPNPDPEKGITVHTAAFGFVTKSEHANANTTSKVTVSNINTLGNSKKSGDVANSGGVIGFEARYVDFTAYNTLNQACEIAYKMSGNEYQNNVLYETKVGQF